MKKHHFLILAFINTLLYWILDASANVSLYDTRLMDELFLKSPQVIPLLKILIACFIFTLTLIPFFIRAKDVTTESSGDELEPLKKITQILFSPLSTKVNISKSLEKLEEILDLEASILFIYNRDTLTIYNENTFIKTLFRTKDIYPFKSNDSQSVVEKMAANCFLQKSAFSQETHKIDKITYTLFSFILQEDKSDKILGNLMLVARNEKRVEQSSLWLPKILELLCFNLSVATKKENLLNLSIQNNTDNSAIDKVLNIMNYIKLQEHIEHEVKRNKRYHTELTLMLLDINMFKNLTNVFPAEVVINLKKDFINFVKKNIRETDVFGKWTNDQFAILLPDVDFRAAQSVARKLQELLEQQKFPRIGKITCSFGITSISPKDTMGSFRIRCESALALASSREGNSIEVKLLV